MAGFRIPGSEGLSGGSALSRAAGGWPAPEVPRPANAGPRPVGLDAGAGVGDESVGRLPAGLGAIESAATLRSVAAHRTELKPGSLGVLVRELQQLLNSLTQPSPHLAIDGIYGPATAAAVAIYQREAGVRNETIVGPATWYALLSRRVAVWSLAAPEKPPSAPPVRPARRPPAGGEKKEPETKQPWTLVSLIYVPNIASGKEDPKPKIKWTIKDPSVAITSGQFELFRTRDPEDAAPIWTQSLSAEQLRDGNHELEWDGQIGGHADFPDSYVSIEFSPYRLKLTVTDGGRKEDKEVKFEVTVVDFEILLGDKAVLGDAKDTALYDVLVTDGALPASGGKRKVKLISNLFKVDGGGTSEMSNSSSASFDQFQTLWGDGPRIPIDAKVWIKNSKGAKVLAPKAWGRRKILWDWECVSPDLSALHAAAKTYEETAQNYNKDVSKPKGENCHKDRGGKRADDGAAVVFSSDSGGGTYPFPVTAGSTRKWSGLSGPAPSGAKEGLSGAIFRPARLAGDGYKVTAYFDPSPKKELDAEGALAAAFKKDTGTFEMWRELHLSKYIKKSAGITGFTVATLQGYYDKAFLRVEDKTPGIETMVKAPYDTAFNAAIAGQPDLVKTYCIDSAASQFDGGDFAVTYRSHAAMKAAYIAKIKGDLQTADPTLTNAAATTAATTQVTAALTAAGIETVTKYANQVRWWSIAICQSACSIYMGANDGITIIQFNGTDNLVPHATSVINGFAPTFTTSGRSKCAFIQYAMTYSGANSNTMEQTISHEVGHHMFLPHAPLPAASLPAGAEADAHDQADLHCLMGYDYSSERKFCGKCLLRMRGWDHSKLDKDGSKNKKP
jgi:hypothetical protein